MNESFTKVRFWSYNQKQILIIIQVQKETEVGHKRCGLRLEETYTLKLVWDDDLNILYFFPKSSKCFLLYYLACIILVNSMLKIFYT